MMSRFFGKCVGSTRALAIGVSMLPLVFQPPSWAPASSREPPSYDANHNLGEFYIQTGKLRSAIPFLKRAQELDPSVYSNGYDLALALEQTGQFEKANEQLHKLISVRDSAELHSLLGEVEEKSQHYLSSA